MLLAPPGVSSSPGLDSFYTGRASPRALALPPDFTMMFFFSNRLGCLGSLLVSVVATLLLLLVMGVVNLR
jgi:hypothetical protein